MILRLRFLLMTSGHQHGSVAKTAPHVWRLQMVGEPILAKHVKTNPAAHARIDNWADAMPWISEKFAAGEAAPAREEVAEALDPNAQA